MELTRREAVTLLGTCAVSSAASGDDARNSVVIPGSGPVNTKAPEVSGTAKVGETLSCSTGTWSGVPAPTFTYQWLRDGGEIATATLSTYKVVAADEGHSLSCKVTATNSEGKEAATSANFVHIPGSKPENSKQPEASGEAKVGATLSCSTGTWTGAPTPTFTYQWLREEAAIEGATESTYKVAGADQGRKLSCKVTATNGEGTASAKSSSAGCVQYHAVAVDRMPDQAHTAALDREDRKCLVALPE